MITISEFRLALLLLVRLDPLIERSSSECSPLFFEVVFHGKIHNFLKLRHLKSDFLVVGNLKCLQHDGGSESRQVPKEFHVQVVPRALIGISEVGDGRKSHVIRIKKV